MNRINTEHIYRIDLTSGPLDTILSRPLMHQDDQADTFAATLYQGDTPVDLTGATVKAYMTFCGIGATLTITGSVQDSMATVTLPKSCYAVPGRFTLAMQVGLDGVRHSALRVTGLIAPTRAPGIACPDLTGSDFLSQEELVGEIDAMREATQAALDAAALITGGTGGGAGTTILGGGGPTVYCWGDSLTEGVGGWLQTPELVQKTIVSAYPDVVGQAYNCINLGCRGETIQSIMARQGADPMVVGGFTIPASSSESVTVGYLRGSYFDADRLGITTASGDLAQPLKETEAGINPCTIGGVEGELYRTMTPDSEGRYTYLFRRLVDGAATDVPAGTTIVTHAMKCYRNGVAVIWMGANGSVSSHTGFIQKIKDMVAYGKYSNYLVILCREYTAQWVVDDANSIEKALTDPDGTCHVLYLVPELLRRGYTLAGISASAGVPDTSSWTTTDEIKKQRPLLMAATGTGENDYETLHFSCYGYKAIGKLVVEKLKSLLGSGSAGDSGVSGDSGGSGDTGDSGNTGGSGDSGSTGGTGTGGGTTTPTFNYETSGTDDIGAFAFKLSEPATSSGQIINTGFVPYDVEKDWTILCRFADDMTPSDANLGSIFEMREYFAADGASTQAFLRKMKNSTGDYVYSFGGGFSGFDFPLNNAPGYTPSTDGWHNVAIIKSGSNYSFYMDGGLAYGAPLGYGVTAEHMSVAPMYLFGRVENSTTLNTIRGTISDFRIYETALSPVVIDSILAGVCGDVTPDEGGDSGETGEDTGETGGSEGGGTVTPDPEPEPEPTPITYVTNGTDDYGSYIFKLAAPATSTGEVVDTGFAPYSTEKAFTILCRFSDSMTPVDGAMGCIFEMREYFPEDSISTQSYLRKLVDGEGNVKYSFAGGFGGFDFPVDNAPGYTPSTDGWHDAVIIKQAKGYHYFYLDGGLAYGGGLVYQVAHANLSDDTMRLFARVENGTTLNPIHGTIADFRIYDKELSLETIAAIQAEMRGA